MVPYSPLYELDNISVNSAMNLEESKLSLEALLGRSLSSSIEPTPRVINDAVLMDQTEDEPPSATMNYIPPKYVADMHAAPRFGHTNRLGKLVSRNPQDAVDYASGLKQFTLFIVVPFIIWGIILVLFKFAYGIRRIGCAAGGEVLDMKALSKQGVSRKIRKRRIVRSFRLQTTFMITGILVPTLSLMMMEMGWSKVQLAWDDVQQVIQDVEALAYRGWNAMDGLQRTKQSLQENRLVQDILKKESTSSLFVSWCPKAQGDERLDFLGDAMSSLEGDTQRLIALFDDYVPQNTNGFVSVTKATEAVDQSIEWFFEHDWIWKMYIMVLNVLNAFLVLCCYIFTKHNIIHPPTRFYLTFWVVPLFTIATILLLMVTASSGIATLMNADFCAGGDAPGSPDGAIRDAIMSFQFGSVSQKHNLTGTLGLVYDCFTYYANGCLTDHPLAFLQDYADQVDQATTYMAELTSNLPDTPETIEMLNTECGANMAFLPKALAELETQLLSVQSNLNAMVNLASCHSISPLLRRLTHGAVCSESAHGLTWIWASSLTICVLCFVMLTTRAALYNATRKRKPRTKKSKRAVEKEFEEYKEFMAEYYDDAALWKLEYLPSKQKQQKSKADILEIDFASELLANPTFETAVTTKPSSDEEDDDNLTIVDFKEVDISRLAGLNHFGDDEEDDGVHKDEAVPSAEMAPDGEWQDEEDDDSTYDSDYESDSDDSAESSGDDESALLSFITETRSILSETKSIASSVASKAMQYIRPLLGNPKDKEDEEDASENDFDFDVENNSLFLQSPPASGQSQASATNELGKLTTPPPRSAKTPTAPQKPFSFLGRTNVTDAADHELVSLTRTPDMTSNPSNAAGVHPRRLKLSPFLDEPPQGGGKPKKAPLPKRRQQQLPSSSRLNLGMTTSTTSTPQPPRRPRARSADSDDMSLYVEDAPKPPEKPYRRLPRTSHGSSARRKDPFR